jgi:hypothetical protein
MRSRGQVVKPQRDLDAICGSPTASSTARCSLTVCSACCTVSPGERYSGSATRGDRWPPPSRTLASAKGLSRGRRLPDDLRGGSNSSRSGDLRPALTTGLPQASLSGPLTTCEAEEQQVLPPADGAHPLPATSETLGSELLRPVSQQNRPGTGVARFAASRGGKRSDACNSARHTSRRKQECSPRPALCWFGTTAAAFGCGGDAPAISQEQGAGGASQRALQSRRCASRRS